MSLNKVLLDARIPFDLEIKNGDDDNKAFLGFSLSVKRNYKPEGEQYYPEDLLYCKAFRQKAKFIVKNFKKGDSITVEAELRRDDDYTPEGATEPVKGQMYVHIVEVYYPSGGRKSGDDAPSEEAASKPANKPAASKPAGKPAAGLNPLSGGAKKRLF